VDAPQRLQKRRVKTLNADRQPVDAGIAVVAQARARASGSRAQRGTDRVMQGSPGRAGGGQNAVALAEVGYEVFAIERERILVEHMSHLLKQHSDKRVKVIKANFYQVELPENGFDAVCYWDGFGIGTDEEQRILLRRICSWLRPKGVMLLDVYTPWHAAKSAGYGGQVGKVRREYEFDGENCRWIDRWWLEETGESVEQSLRCYSPADLRLLLESTGLELERVEPGGMMNYESGQFVETASLELAMWYVAVLRKAM